MSNQDLKQELGPAEREAIFWYWRLQERDLPVSEWHLFRQWHAIAAHREAFDAMATVWEYLDHAPRMSSASATSPPPVRHRLPRMLARAAIVVLIVTLLGPDVGFSPQVLRTGATQRALVLDDGSIVRAAPNTRLEIYVGRHHRSSHLTRGQAFFRVADDPKRPFIVTTPVAVTEALGTSFGVSFVNGVLDVTVTEGTVAVSRSTHSEEGWAKAASPAALKVHAGQQIRVLRDHVSIEPDVDSDRALAWATIIEFAETPIAKAVEEFNRRNGMRLELLNPRAAGNIRLSGAYQLDQPASFAQSVADKTSSPVRLQMPGRQAAARILQPSEFRSREAPL